MIAKHLCLQVLFPFFFVSFQDKNEGDHEDAEFASLQNEEASQVLDELCQQFDTDHPEFENPENQIVAPPSPPGHSHGTRRASRGKKSQGEVGGPVVRSDTWVSECLNKRLKPEEVAKNTIFEKGKMIRATWANDGCSYVGRKFSIFMIYSKVYICISVFKTWNYCLNFSTCAYMLLTFCFIFCL